MVFEINPTNTSLNMSLLLLEVSLVVLIKAQVMVLSSHFVCAYVGSRTQQWKYLTSKRMGMLKIGEAGVWFQTITPLSVTVREICQTLKKKKQLKHVQWPWKKSLSLSACYCISITKYQTKCSLFKMFWNWCCAHSEVHKNDFVWCGISWLHKAAGLNFEFSNHLSVHISAWPQWWYSCLNERKS